MDGWQRRKLEPNLDQGVTGGYAGYALVINDHATRRIRSSNRASIPIVAVTASAMPEDGERRLNDYLAKPIAMGPLQDVLVKWLPVVA